MKKKLPIIAIILIFAVGVGVLAYPLVSAMINNMSTRADAESEIKHIKQMETAEMTELFARSTRRHMKLSAPTIPKPSTSTTRG